MQLGKEAVSVQQYAQGVSIKFVNGSAATTDFLVAADGIHSIARKQLLPESSPQYSGYTCWRAVVDELPPTIDLDEMTETWGKGRRFGVVPIGKNRIYWFATLNAPANDPRMRGARVRDLQEYFRDFIFQSLNSSNAPGMINSSGAISLI